MYQIKYRELRSLKNGLCKLTKENYIMDQSKIIEEEKGQNIRIVILTFEPNFTSSCEKSQFCNHI